jgi:hypothetical protein
MNGRHYLDDATVLFRKMKQMAERALTQVNDEQFFAQLDAESNSLALIVKHMAGNARSRWRDFLTSDGEKPDRHRDSEFEIVPDDTRAALMERWERGWQYLFEALEPLRGNDLMRKVRIRNEEHTILQAINRQLAHYANHVGQITSLAKHYAGSNWQTLSIPRGKSEEFNAKMKKAPDTESQLRHLHSKK